MPGASIAHAARPFVRSAAVPARPARPAATAHFICRKCIFSAAAGRRSIQISAAPATEYPPKASGDAFSARDDADARFEVLGSPYSLLSVSLSASQKLYTRRGTLVSVAGKAENAQSTLAVLAPVRRALLGIPFLYQRISSTTPLTLLIGTRAASTTLFTLRLDGTTDWVVAQRHALLAWTGHTLSVTPQRHRLGNAGAGGMRSALNLDGLGLGLSHWGSSFITGRGLVALAAPGYIYPVTLAAGEELVVHPSHVVAYAVQQRHQAPRPFRFRSGPGDVASAASAAASTAAASVAQATQRVGLRLQVPRAAEPPVRQLQDMWQTLRASAAYKAAAATLFTLRTLLRRTIWGDRLFLHVRGPTTLLLSSRGVRMAEVLTRDDVNDMADAEPGVVPAAEAAATESKADAAGKVDIHVAAAAPGGKAEFADAKDLKAFVR